MRFGILGAGLIGKKRAEAIARITGASVTAIADREEGRARSLAEFAKATASKDSSALLARDDVDAVVIATTNDALSPLAAQAVRAGKHVLLEKPGARNTSELAELERASAENPSITVRVGFNHRFHPAILRARSIVRSGKFGPLFLIRARYGHGGRVGYDKEWRANPKFSGGGELLDQGCHLVDLSRHLGGDFRFEWGRAETQFWDMPVDDNGYIFLKTPEGASAWLHASCSEWKNLFDFEIYCRTGKVQVTGLGRSYGVEEIKVFAMKPEMGPPDVQAEAFPGEDDSWKLETEAFLAEIKGERTQIARLEDARCALEIIESTYAASGMRFP